MAERTGLAFVVDGEGDLRETFGPQDAFYYIYAVLHSPGFRECYAEFLKRDFPHVPLTGDPELFGTLVHFGSELVALHVLESPAVSQSITRYPVPGDNQVERGHPKYVAPGEPAPRSGKTVTEGRVYISSDQPQNEKRGQYFEGISPDVWEHHVGGYQVCEKWLQDRRGRQLSYDELTCYQQIIVAIAETQRLVREIDEAIPGWPLP